LLSQVAGLFVYHRFAAEEFSMSRSSRGLIRSLLALAFVAALVPAAQAATTQTNQTPKRHHHVYTYTREVVRHPGEIYVNRAPRSYLDYGEPNTGPDYTSNLYMEDTAYPQYLLGPGIFQRLLTSPGQYN
jgi:hypothetical protein